MANEEDRRGFSIPSSSDGSNFTYTWQLDGDTLRIYFGDNDSDMYFGGTFNNDGSQYSGAWYYPDGGGYDQT